MDMIKLFTTMIILQLFYSFSITAIAYGLPENAKSYAFTYSDITNKINVNSTSTYIEKNVRSQTKLPLIELGALVFYSGNLLIDLILNFAFAIPQMVTMFINGLMILINVDPYLSNLVELFSTGIISVLYFIGVVQLLVGIRSGRVV